MSIDSALAEVNASLPIEENSPIKAAWRFLSLTGPGHDGWGGGGWTAIAVRSVVPVWSTLRTDTARLVGIGVDAEAALLALAAKLRVWVEGDIYP